MAVPLQVETATVTRCARRLETVVMTSMLHVVRVVLIAPTIMQVALIFTIISQVNVKSHIFCASL